MKRSGIVIGAWTLLALMVIPLYPHFVSPNELTRWALVAAAVESRTIEVSSTARILGPRFEDLAVVDGRVYSNKAPGAALASAPGYLLARPFYGPPSAGNIRPVANAMRVVASTLPAVLMAIAFIAVALHVPSAATFARLLFDPSRGLLVFSPVLVLAIPAYAAARRHMRGPAWWTLLAIPATIILVYSGYPNWHGGWNVGPRYIAAAIPFLVLPLLFRRGGAFESLLAGFSALAVLLTSLVFPFPPNAFPFPWISLAAPLAFDGLVIPNLLHLVARPAAIAMPILLILAGAAAAHRRPAMLLLLCGALAAIIAGSQWWRLGNAEMVNLQRRYIAEVYFEQADALGEAPVGLRLRRASELRQPPISWPF